MGALIDLKGQRFGRLLVIGKAKKSHRQVYWTCQCDCGNKKDICGSSLRRGLTHSCGCLIIESNIAGAKHYMCNTRFYSIWAGMKDRITNKNHKSYHNYGGRGIQLYKKWYEFVSFKDDMYKSYLKHIDKYGEQNTSIDRINNNIGYNKKNCKWSTRMEQARNQRSNIYIEYNGKKQILEDWANEISISASCLWNRLFKIKWSVEKSLTTPSQGNWKSRIKNK